LIAIKRRISLFLLLIVIVFPANIYAAPHPILPASAKGTTISLPFPVEDLPVGVSSAEISISWIDREGFILLGDRDYLSYRGILSADYTIRFTGEESAIVKVAFPMPDLGDFGSRFRREYPGLTSDQIFMYIDGVPAEIFGYRIHEDILISGPEDLADRETPILRNFINYFRAYMAGETNVASAFEFDMPMSHYTFTITAPSDEGIRAVDLTFHYDPEKTILTYLSSRRFSPTARNNLGMTQINDTISITQSEGNVIEIFLIGENTLTWEYELTFLNWVDEADINTLYDAFNLNVTTDYKTPRNYFRQIQESTSRHRYSETIIDPDFLMDWINSIFVNQHENNLWNLINLNRSYVDLSRFRRLHMLDEQNIIAVEIPFEPGQERILSVSFPVYSSVEWDRENPNSLFHHTILTETSEYWDFFDSLTVTTGHPNDIAEYVLMDGFETFDNFSQITLQNPSNSNIYFGFWLPDGRRPTRVLLVVLLVLVLVFVVPTIIVALILWTLRRLLIKPWKRMRKARY